MARSKSFFGLRRGSAGGFTYSKGINGEQITRAKAESVRNPQTKSQMAQRMLFSAIGYLASKFAYIVDHSTQGAAPRAKALAEFRSMNLKNLHDGTMMIIDDKDPSDATFAVKEYKSGGIAYGNLQISAGDLEGRDVALNDNKTVFVDARAMIPTGSNMTWREFLKTASLLEGDWLTFIIPMVYNMQEWSDQVWQLDEVHFVRFAVKTNIPADVLNGNALIQSMPQVFDITTSMPEGYDLTAGMFTIGDARGLGIRFSYFNALSDEKCVAIIHSRTDEGGKHRSPAWVSCRAGNIHFIVNSWPIGQALLLDGGDASWNVGSVPTYQPGGGGGMPRPRPIAPSDEPEP